MNLLEKKPFYYFSIERDSDKDWGYGEIPKENHDEFDELFIFEDFESACSEAFNFFSYMSESFRGKPYLIDSLKYFLDFISKESPLSDNCSFETFKDGCTISLDLNKEAKEFYFNFEGGNSHLYFSIKKIKINFGGK